MAEVEALYYEKLDNGVLRCVLCPHHCKLKDGQAGLCRVRTNHAGILFHIQLWANNLIGLGPY